MGLGGWRVHRLVVVKMRKKNIVSFSFFSKRVSKGWESSLGVLGEMYTYLECVDEFVVRSLRNVFENQASPL